MTSRLPHSKPHQNLNPNPSKSNLYVRHLQSNQFVLPSQLTSYKKTYPLSLQHKHLSPKNQIFILHSPNGVTLLVFLQRPGFILRDFLPGLTTRPLGNLLPGLATWFISSYQKGETRRTFMFGWRIAWLGCITEGVNYQKIKMDLIDCGVQFHDFRFMGASQALISLEFSDSMMEAIESDI
jgi:hypothetical protein